jgi:hypothetical protein
MIVSCVQRSVQIPGSIGNVGCNITPSAVFSSTMSHLANFLLEHKFKSMRTFLSPFSLSDSLLHAIVATIQHLFAADAGSAVSIDNKVERKF